jgi:hypothetical protein
MFKQKMIYRLTLTFILFLGITTLQAQSNFLYIQSANNQPFGVELKGSNYPSNARGYLMIPQLQNGDYSINVSFGASQESVYTYSFTISDRPKGYSLKLTPEGEWILLDMVTLEITRGLSSDFGQQKMGAVANKPANKQIQKVSERTTPKGIEQIYSVKNGLKTDKVDVLLPLSIETPSSSIRQKSTKQ